MRALAVLTVAWAAVTCKAKTPSEPSGPATAATVITITASGVSPRDVQIALGDRVLFDNRDTRPHTMTSDPHPEHSDCPPVNQVGFLSAGQQRETGNFVQARTCGFHDHDLPDVQSLRGSITIR
jgi:plastocyanin